MDYYRYYADNSHLLKYVVDAAGYARLTAQGDPRLASDEQVANVATNYFQYDELQRVVAETVGGGTQKTTLQFFSSEYVDNDDYNRWTRKTIEVRPDGSTNTVYTNFLGQVLLKDLQSSSDRWTEYRQYDGNAHQVSLATPSSVISYSEDYSDGTLSVTLQASSGLIRLTAYYTSGDSVGYVQSKSVKQGSGGTPIVVSEFAYTSQSAGGATVKPLASQTLYRNIDHTGPITTTFDYTWYSGTTQVQQRTTTLPAIPTDQNGSGIAAMRLEYYDQYSNRIWEQGPRGFIDNFTYDIPTGAMVQHIEDVNTSLLPPPTGWTRPSGLQAPLNLVTDYEFDSRGRTTQTLGAVHPIDGVGVRTALDRVPRCAASSLVGTWFRHRHRAHVPLHARQSCQHHTKR